MGTRMRRTLWLLWIVLMGGLTLQATPPKHEVENTRAQPRVTWQTADFVRNVALFAPFGWLLALGGTRRSRVLLAAAATSGGIELAQTLLPGRYPGLTDVLANALGAGLGASLPVLTRATLSSPARSARVSLAWALLAAAAFAAPGALVRPSLPDSVYYGGWTPLMGQYWPYAGRVREARLGRERLGTGRLPDSDAVRNLLLREAELSVEATAGPPPPSLSALVTIHDDDQREILLLGVNGEDLVFRLRTLADVLRLEPPEWRAREALVGVAPGDLLTVGVLRRGRSVSIESGGKRFDALGFTCGDGWRLLLPRDRIPKRLDPVLALLWVAALWLPLGLWARARLESGVAVAVTALVLAAAPGLGLQATPVAHWLSAAAALAAGSRLRGAFSRRLGSGRVSR